MHYLNSGNDTENGEKTLLTANYEVVLIKLDI